MKHDGHDDCEQSTQLELQANRQKFIKSVLTGVGLVAIATVLLTTETIGEESWLLVAMMGAGYPLMRR